MKSMTGSQIRKTFLEFFAERGHRTIRSHALVPPNDPTLYFVNAGMVQFKDLFVGAREADYTTATSSQKCLRVSGKHNDLENVGRTARHHTLFEMLGNFSFGDYFKTDACKYAWEFLTQVVELPIDRIHITVHPDDDETRVIWRDVVGVSMDRIHDDPENFWSMGDTGPCGPCSEIHFDFGPAYSDGKDVEFGTPEADARYNEIWNLVFMQSDRAEDGTMTPLPKQSIDTGMGLERLARLLQGEVATNYDTDLFLPLIQQMASLAGVTYGADVETDVALRVIADHSRAAAFLVADGIYPDNEGRGYVLRRIMRRAIRFGRILGVEKPFLVETTATVVAMFGEDYPELREGQETIHRIVLQEEKRFGKTIKAGLKRLSEALDPIESGGTLDGRVAFELYDTYGFPPDLTRLISEDHGVALDETGFDEAMEEQRTRARAASKFGIQDTAAYQTLVEAGFATEFTGYSTAVGESTVSALLVEGERIPLAASGQRLAIVTAVTPFYAESGGQVGDIGHLRTETGVIRIETTQKPFGDLIVHFGEVESGHVTEGQAVALAVDEAARDATRKNHSATHLMHFALRDVLGEHVRQRGSLVGPDRLRFDFSHTGAMTPEEIVRVEQAVNELVLANETVETSLMTMDDALDAGAIAFFEDKYGDEVRVLKVGSTSTELCGGIHAKATGDIGLFKILGESAISSGVRRVEAVTGMGAVRWCQQQTAMVRGLAEDLRVGVEQLKWRVDKLAEDNKTLTSDLAEATVKAQVAGALSALDDAKTYGEFKAAAVRLDGVGGKELRALAERLRDQLGGSGAVMVAGQAGEKVSLIVAATKDASAKLHAGKVVGALAPLVGGRGGGRPDMAQAGGTDGSRLDEVLTGFYSQAEAAFTA